MKKENEAFKVDKKLDLVTANVIDYEIKTNFKTTKCY